MVYLTQIKVKNKSKMPNVRNMSFDQFAEKFTGDAEHILEYVVGCYRDLGQMFKIKMRKSSLFFSQKI